MATLIKNTRMLRDDRLQTGDIVVDGPRICSFSDSSNGGAVYQFNNCIVLPGFLDVHVHLRQPGFSYKETIASGSAAAARGGYTAVCAMPNVNPAPDSPETLRQQLDIIARDAVIDVFPYACITMGQQGRELVDFAQLAPRVAAFSNDGRGVQDEGVMREAMRRAKDCGAIIAAHCEDETLLSGGYIHSGAYAKKHGHAGISSASEYKQIERDIELAAETGCRYHVCHVSAKESVEIIHDAKKSGVNVSCETAPHYLLLCDDDLQELGRFKMNPPIRAAADRDALLEGLFDGTIDCIATDHAPHAENEKNSGLKDSLMGVVGIETAFRVLHTKLVVEQQLLTLAQLVDKLSAAPRRIFGIPGGLESGQYADFCVVDLALEGVVDPGEFRSMGRATPFEGWKTVGDVVATFYRGNPVYINERYGGGV